MTPPLPPESEKRVSEERVANDFWERMTAPIAEQASARVREATAKIIEMLAPKPERCTCCGGLGYAAIAHADGGELRVRCHCCTQPPDRSQP